MKIVRFSNYLGPVQETPAKGTLTLSKTENPEAFDLAKVGLGGLGIVTEVRTYRWLH